MSKFTPPFKYHSMFFGTRQVNFTTLNRHGERIFYCIIEENQPYTNRYKYVLYRACKEWEPQARAHLNHVSYKDMFEVHPSMHSACLGDRVAKFIQEN